MEKIQSKIKKEVITMTQYYTVRGFKNKKMIFESIALNEKRAKELMKDILINKNTKGGSWMKNARLTLKKI